MKLHLKKLNGWQRIFLVFMVPWALAAGARTFATGFHYIDESYYEAFSQCYEQKLGPDWRLYDGSEFYMACNASALGAKWFALGALLLDTMLWAFGPPLVLYGLIYCFIRLVRWIRAGFGLQVEKAVVDQTHMDS